MMSDMSQVAERLRVAQTISKYFAYDGSKDRDQLYSIDQQCAIIEWLAERDPTPLTVEVMQSFGATVRNVIADMSRLSFVLTIDGKWLCHTHSVVISTVGELRTLARLAEVELKKGGK